VVTSQTDQQRPSDQRPPREARSRPRFDPADVDVLAGQLSPEELLIRDTTRAFVRGRVLGEIAGWFERGEFPRALVPELGELGLLGMALDGYGCAATSAVAYGLASMELEAGDSGLRSFVSVQSCLAMYPIHAYGSDEQRERWLPPMARGEMVGCFGLTEPDAGSDPSSMRTRARRDGADWVLDGTKMWITNGSFADVAVIWAQTEDGIRGFLVPAGTPGFSAHEVGHKLSLRASATAELVLDSCRVPADAVLPGVSGLRGPLSCLNEARFGIVWGTMGAARACFEAALAYSTSRQQFGRPIASFQLTQAKLADMAVEIEKGLLLALHLNNVREALAIARTARTILGANGITLDYPVMRHAANLESVLTYEGTSEVHQLSIGRALTGLGAFS